MLQGGRRRSEGEDGPEKWRTNADENDVVAAHYASGAANVLGERTSSNIAERRANTSSDDESLQRDAIRGDTFAKTPQQAPVKPPSLLRKDRVVMVGYVFATGVVVLWGMKRNPEDSKRFTSDLLWFLQQFAVGHLRVDRMEEDFMEYCYIDELPENLVPRSRIKHDVLYLKTHSSSEKAAVSFAFATSIRLCIVA
eukprot:GHVS01076209.1.p1 GENE.GHVS01076209.1~~GHVS01076209.1.p1  ORF type:complete len:196 (+),score=14.59 GHVS01076209.1:983-1570(+)